MCRVMIFTSANVNNMTKRNSAIPTEYFSRPIVFNQVLLEFWFEHKLWCTKGVIMSFCFALYSLKRVVELVIIGGTAGI